MALLALALVSFGLVMVYSSSSAVALLSDGDPLQFVVRQAIYAVIGLGAYAVLVAARPQTLARLGPASLAVAAALLLAVLAPGMGTAVNGSRRWIELGLVNVQPSELAKLALILWLAQAVTRDPARMLRREGLVPVMSVVGVLCLLILVEPDLGTAIVLGAIALAMLVVAGARMQHLALAAGGAILLSGVAIMAADYRRARLLAFLDPWSDPDGTGFQAVQAQVALGSGGLTGVGLGDGLQKAFYLPEAHTDMILATVGEELGLLGVTAVLVAYAAFAVAGYRIAYRAADLHQQLLAAGVTTYVVGQAMVNVGAVLGVMPLTGVPLPLVSFGGSSLIVLLASAGILVNVGRRSHSPRARGRTLRPARARGDRGRGDGRPRHAGAGGGRRAAGARG